MVLAMLMVMNYEKVGGGGGGEVDDDNLSVLQIGVGSGRLWTRLYAYGLGGRRDGLILAQVTTSSSSP